MFVHMCLPDSGRKVNLKVAGAGYHEVMWAPGAPSDCSLAASARRIFGMVKCAGVSNRAVARCTDR